MKELITSIPFILFLLLAPQNLKAQDPSIPRLTLGQVVPDELFEKYDSRTLGELIVYWLHIDEERRRQSAASKPFDWMRQTDIQFFFFEDRIDNLTNFGMRNQHQTGTTREKVIYAPHDRALIEDILAGVKLEANYDRSKSNPKHILRHKYGIAEIHRNEAFGHKTDVPWMYGDMIAVMKDEVKRRATWTHADSKAIIGEYKYDFKLFEPDRWKYQGTFFSEQIQNIAGHFFEVQILGELTLADVKYFMIKADTSEETVKKLKKIGLPIYTYKQRNQFKRHRFMKDKLVYKGNPKKIEEFEVELAQSRKGNLSKILASYYTCQELFKHHNQ